MHPSGYGPGCTLRLSPACCVIAPRWHGPTTRHTPAPNDDFVPKIKRATGDRDTVLPGL